MLFVYSVDRIFSFHFRFVLCFFFKALSFSQTYFVMLWLSNLNVASEWRSVLADRFCGGLEHVRMSTSEASQSEKWIHDIVPLIIYISRWGTFQLFVCSVDGNWFYSERHSRDHYSSLNIIAQMGRQCLSLFRWHNGDDGCQLSCFGLVTVFWAISPPKDFLLKEESCKDTALLISVGTLSP